MKNPQSGLFKKRNKKSVVFVPGSYHMEDENRWTDKEKLQGEILSCHHGDWSLWKQSLVCHSTNSEIGFFYILFKEASAFKLFLNMPFPKNNL